MDQKYDKYGHKVGAEDSLASKNNQHEKIRAC